MSHIDLLPSDSPMKDGQTRMMVQKALQRISRRLSKDPLTTKNEAIMFIQATFAGEGGFGPEGLTTAELYVMWNESAEDCADFMNRLTNQHGMSLQDAEEYLRHHMKRYTENVIYEAVRLLTRWSPHPPSELNNSVVNYGRSVAPHAPGEHNVRQFDQPAGPAPSVLHSAPNLNSSYHTLSEHPNTPPSRLTSSYAYSPQRQREEYAPPLDAQAILTNHSTHSNYSEAYSESLAETSDISDVEYSSN